MARSPKSIPPAVDWYKDRLSPSLAAVELVHAAEPERAASGHPCVSTVTRWVLLDIDIAGQDMAEPAGHHG